MGEARKAYKPYRRKKPSIKTRALWLSVVGDYDGDEQRAAHAWPSLYEAVHGKPPEPFDDRPEEMLDR